VTLALARILTRDALERLLPARAQRRDRFLRSRAHALGSRSFPARGCTYDALDRFLRARAGARSVCLAFACAGRASDRFLRASAGERFLPDRAGALGIVSCAGECRRDRFLRSGVGAIYSFPLALVGAIVSCGRA